MKYQFDLTCRACPELYDVKSRLPEQDEKVVPDYSLYPFVDDKTAYGFLTRGCIRKRDGKQVGSGGRTGTRTRHRFSARHRPALPLATAPGLWSLATEGTQEGTLGKRQRLKEFIINKPRI